MNEDNIKKDPFNKDARKPENGSQTAHAQGEINIVFEDLVSASYNQLTPAESVSNLWDFLKSKAAARSAAIKTGPETAATEPIKSSFTLENVIYFFGALIIIAAMSIFIGMTFEQLGGPGISAVSLIYIFSFVWAGSTLWFDKGQKTPGGLLITIAVCIVPLFVYGIEVMLDLWPQGRPGSYHEYHVWIKGSWIIMEIATIIAGSIALKFVRFPFLSMPIAFSAWYLSMDLTPIIFGTEGFNYEERLWISFFCGIIMLVTAYVLDRTTKEDFSFWLYLFGVIAFWGGLSLMKNGSEFGKLEYCMINVLMVFISVLIQRRVFIVFGSLGILGYLGYLSHSIFKDAIGFTFGLTLLGLAIISIGLFYSKNREFFETLPERMPEGLKRHLPQYRPK